MILASEMTKEGLKLLGTERVKFPVGRLLE